MSYIKKGYRDITFGVKKVVKQKPYPNHAPEIKSKQILVERDPDTDNDKKSEEVSHVKAFTCETRESQIHIIENV